MDEMIFRQGDVLIIACDLPQGEQKPVKRESGKIVLAHGEVTGHAHAVADRSVRFVEVAQERFLLADAPFEVRHEEHATVKVPTKGTFKVIRQVEYAPEAIRMVAD